MSRAHGVHGEVRVVPSSDNPDRFAPGSVLYGRPGRSGVVGQRAGEDMKLTVETCRGGDAFPVVSFRGIHDRTAAEALRGYVLFIGGDQLPELEDDEYYPFDLVGLTVRGLTGSPRGVVVDAVESPAHALLVVRLAAEGSPAAQAPREVLVPFVREAVPTVDVAQGYVVIDDAFLG